MEKNNDPNHSEPPSLMNTLPLLKDINNIVPLGVHLGIPLPKLHQIEKENKDLERQKIEMIHIWVSNCSDCSWGRLADAVKCLGGHNQLVSEIKKLDKNSPPETESNQPGASGVNATLEDDSENSENNEIQSDSQSVGIQPQSASASCDSKPTPRELRLYVRDHVLDKWEELADELGLDDSDKVSEELEKIRAKWKTDKKKAAFEVLKLWLKHYKATATWQALLDALQKLKLDRAVTSIQCYLLDNGTRKNRTTDLQASMESESYSEPQSSSTSLPQQQQSLMEIVATTTNTDMQNVPACDKFAIQMKQDHNIRNYQYELAKPGIDGENYIIFAPTNSGKTLMAALVISDHLKRNPRQRKGLGPKVVMIVKTRLLADQQTKRLKEYIPGARVECSRGNDEEDSQQSEQLPSVSDALPRSDIIVCTAGKLVDGLRKGNLAIENISLLVLDECHNTDKGSNYAQIMHAYLEQKIDQKMQGNQLPQILGLTATPGVGKNPGLNPLKEVDKLISLCAQVDATSGIKFVKENIEELNRLVPKSEYCKAIVKQSEEREKFIQRVIADVEKCETFLAFEFNSPSKFTRWSQTYEQEVKKMRKLLEDNDNPNDKDKISTVRVLECLCHTLMAYMDLPYALATTPLKEYDDLNIPEKLMSDHDKQLKGMLAELEADLEKLPSCENPILEELKEILADRFQHNPKSEGIVFVRTREQAKAISEWISKSKFALDIRVRSHMLLGHKRPEETGPSMSDAEQKAVISAFHSGEYNLLVATSVAEEGLDIQQCNLVMRLHVSSPKAKAQMQGRARAEDSEIITIMSDDPEKHYKDMLNDEQLFLTEQVIQHHLPSYYDRFADIIASKQREIVESVKRQREAQKQLVSTHSAQNVVLKCNKCKAVACRGSDLYVIDKTGHHVVPGNVLCYEIHEHRNSGMRVCEFDGSIIKKIYKVHCSSCGMSWGALGYWPKSENEFPILKCCSFNFFINGVQTNFKQWKKRPFKVLPLSHWFAQNKSED